MSETRNLLDETLASFQRHNLDPADITYIGSSETDHCCSWSDFVVLANVEYSAGYGAQEVARDLIIVFSDGTRMERGEYDGSEWWEVRKPFVPKETQTPIKKLVGGMWDSLKELAEEE